MSTGSGEHDPALAFGMICFNVRIMGGGDGGGYAPCGMVLPRQLPPVPPVLQMSISLRPFLPMLTHAPRVPAIATTPANPAAPATSTVASPSAGAPSGGDTDGGVDAEVEAGVLVMVWEAPRPLPVPGKIVCRAFPHSFAIPLWHHPLVLFRASILSLAEFGVHLPLVCAVSLTPCLFSSPFRLILPPLLSLPPPFAPFPSPASPAAPQPYVPALPGGPSLNTRSVLACVCLPN